MPYQIGWQKEKRIVKLMVHGDMTIAEAKNLNRTVLQYLDQAANTSVHLLIDATQINRFPNSSLQIRTLFTFLEHPALGHLVFIDQTTQGNMLLHVMSNILRDSYHVFDTHKTALEFLKTHDASLNWFNTLPIKLPWGATALSSETQRPSA
jgi:hypothetical protein